MRDLILMLRRRGAMNAPALRAVMGLTAYDLAEAIEEAQKHGAIRWDGLAWSLTALGSQIADQIELALCP